MIVKKIPDLPSNPPAILQKKRRIKPAPIKRITHF